MEPDWAKWIRENMPKELYTQAQSSWARTGRILNDVISERDRMREALTPSAETKAAYMGDFVFQLGDRSVVNVPWPIIKEIMAAVRDRADNTEAEG